MKKKLLIVAVTVIIVSIFVSCSANSGSENVSTTAVTDGKGATRYYEPVTDDEGKISTTSKDQGVFAEIETESNGKVVTRKDGTYVTNEHTTILTVTKEGNGKTTSAKKQEQSATKKQISTNSNSDADNEVPFESSSRKSTTTTTTEKKQPSTSTTKLSTTTTEKTTHSVTDEDGWINKWY